MISTINSRQPLSIHSHLALPITYNLNTYYLPPSHFISHFSLLISHSVPPLQAPRRTNTLPISVLYLYAAIPGYGILAIPNPGQMNNKLDKQIMMVDDNSIDHFIIATLCRKLNLHKPLLSFEHPELAIDFLTTQPMNVLPHLVLLDLNTPGMNGFDFLRIFALLPSHIRQHCKIIMLSSSLTPTEISMLHANPHVIRFMEKPLLMPDLENILTII
jgi:CheY-like chemotaxis protein